MQQIELHENDTNQTLQYCENQAINDKIQQIQVYLQI